MNPTEREKPMDRFGLAGQRLDNKYDVEGEVAEGGFGVVYRGKHRALQTSVAIKVLKMPAEFSEAARTEFAKKFLAEAQTLAQLQHPAIVRALDFGVSPMPSGETAPWMVLEWVEGQSLHAWLAARGGRPCTPEETLALLRPVFEALAVAHDHGIAHRDIKPANIMIPAVTPGRSMRGYGPAARVLDFGIAKAMRPEETSGSGATRTASGLLAFSLQYAAPEQVGATRTGPWTDVHALALVLTEMLTGRRPYPGTDNMEITMSVLSPTRPTPAAFGVDAGPWEPVLARALAVRPTDRYSHAAEMLQALEERVPARVAVLDGSDLVATVPAKGANTQPSFIQTAPPSTLRPSAVPIGAPMVTAPVASRSNKAVWAFAGAIALAGVVVLGAALSAAGRNTETPPANVTATVTPPPAPTPPAPTKAPAAQPVARVPTAPVLQAAPTQPVARPATVVQDAGVPEVREARGRRRRTRHGAVATDGVAWGGGGAPVQPSSTTSSGVVIQ
jgi:serine/threonine-protein kinase